MALADSVFIASTSSLLQVQSFHYLPNIGHIHSSKNALKTRRLQ